MRPIRRIRQFIFILVLAISAIALTAPSPKVTAAANDCNVVNEVCNDMGEMMYNLCILDGRSATECASAEAQYRIDCKTNNGCPPGGN